MQNLKTISVPSLKYMAGKEEISLHGGILYVNGSQVQSYFSRNAFYWEDNDVQGTAFLHEHGLMADVCIIKNGEKNYYKAESQMHYKMNYTGDDGEQHLDIFFGVAVDSKGDTYYYCGLNRNNEVIIPIPKSDEELKNQKIMSVKVTEKDLLNIIMDTSSFSGVYPNFAIAKIDMTFDAAYNTCDATITEKTLDVENYMAQNVNNSLAGSVAAKGDCTVQYEDCDKVAHTVELSVDSVKDKDELKYYCSVVYDKNVIVNMPDTEEGKVAQNLISCASSASGKWNVSLHGLKITDDLQIYMNVMENKASITENKSKAKIYTTHGEIVLTENLKNRNRLFRADAAEMGRLKQNYTILRDSGEYQLTVDELFSLNQPPSVEVEDKNTGNKTILDGQAYSHQKSTEILSYLAAYYTADIKSSDDNISYSDLYGYTKDAALAQIREVNPKIISEIEDEKDEKGKQYVIDFLKKFSDIILSSSYAGSENAYIQKGFANIEKPVDRCQYYLSDDHENSLQHEKGYQVAINIIDKYVYASLVTKLESYLNDTETDWAEELYYYAVKRLPLLQLQAFGNSNKGTHIAKMLAILDSEKHVIKEGKNGEPLRDSDGSEIKMPYGAALYAQLLNKSLAEIGNTFKGIDKLENYLKILEVFFGDLYDKVKSGDVADIPEEIFTEIQKCISDDRQAFIDLQIFELQNIMQFMAASGDISSAFAKYGPDSKLFSRLSCCMMYIVMGVSYASVFSNWNSLTDAEKAECIMGSLYAVLGSVREAGIWMSVKTIMDPAASAEERVQAAFRLKFGGEDFERIEGAIPKTGNQPFKLSDRLENVSRQYSFEIKEAGGGTIKTEMLTKFFQGVELVFKLLDVALMAFAFIMATIDLVKLFKYDYSAALRTVAVINDITLGISFLAGAASFVLSFTALAECSLVASVLPVVGAICMFASFIFSIVEAFLKPKEPKPPIQLFIEEHLAVTVKALDPPSSDWEKKKQSNNMQTPVLAG